MDVDQQHFNVHLLDILRHIANAEFVAFDLEMSGIGTSPRRSRKPSIQEVYEDVKAAAETYQVLQVGITCIEKDEESDMYVARPYNFHLSPLFLQGDRLGIERNFCFSSSALHFLLGQKVLFDISAPFKTGVHYLSRDEEKCARDKFNNVTYDDVEISANDADALAFYRNTRQSIKEWLKDRTDSKPYVNIELTCRYGLRLVHQLVRLEFPKLLARYIRDCDFVHITVRDDEREARFTKIKRQTFEDNITRQIGLRFLFEALFGGDLSKINSDWFCIDQDGKPAFTDLHAKEKELKGIIESLKLRRPALVGHNLLTDLAFMYKTFIGLLPDTCEEFSSKVHSLCPIIVDTKYLATHNCGSMDTKSDLQGLLDDCEKLPKPFICLAEKHTSYGSKYKSHEAGYDSWMTAQVLIKLAAKLRADQEFVEIKKRNPPKRPVYIPNSPASSIDNDSSTDNGGVSLLDLDNDDFELLMGHHRSLCGKARVDLPKPKHIKLRGPGEEPEKMGVSMLLNNGRPPKVDLPGQPKQWIPAWVSPFWNDYVNKLRVFQAEEGFYELKEVDEMNTQR